MGLGVPGLFRSQGLGTRNRDCCPADLLYGENAEARHSANIVRLRRPPPHWYT